MRTNKVRKPVFSFLCLISLFSLFLGPMAATTHAVKKEYPIHADLNGKPGPYKQFLLDIIQKWPDSRASFDFRRLNQNDPQINPIELEGFETPDTPFAIGLKQTMVIKAPLAQVGRIIEDFDHYKDLFPVYKKVHVQSQYANLILTHWEAIVPVFFIPNVHYETRYIIDQSVSGRRVYRWELIQGKNLIWNEGLIVIESMGGQTLYTEYDFFNADWGPLKVL